jgi:uncharacterized protein (DUF1810 family)
MDTSGPTGCGLSFHNCLVWVIAPWLSDMPSGIWNQARRYLADPILGDRLRHDVRLIVSHKGKSALEILGSPDDLKFRSCITLFYEAASDKSDRSLFAEALQQFYNGEADPRTLELLRHE